MEANCSILGTGSALPDRVVTNLELEGLTGFSAARMLELFEIHERRWSRGVEDATPRPGQRCSDLAIAAARAALEAAGLAAAGVGALVAVSTTPDSLNPSLDFLVAKGLGLHGAPAFTLQAPCTGLFRALVLADALLPRLDGRPVLVVAADTPSPFFRFGSEVATDQVLNSVLYADGAGAMLVGPPRERMPSIEWVEVDLNAGESDPGVVFPGMLSSSPPAPGRFESMDYLGRHDFRRVLRRGGKLAADAAWRVLRENGLEPRDVRYFLTHQATGNMQRIGASFGLPAEKIPVNIGLVGNTVSASVLVLLDELARAGRLARGDVLVFHTAESSSWSSAGMLARW